MKSYLLLLLAPFLTLNLFGQNKSELKEGMNAPDFTLEDAYGNTFTLSSYNGKSPVIVYFYPEANTSGCTKQACGIRDDWSKFKKNNIEVLGISVDSKEKIKKFIDDYSLNFPLLSDADKKVSEDYGVLKENGKDRRVTFIIDKNSKIAKIINVTDISSHAEEVFNFASKLN